MGASAATASEVLAAGEHAGAADLGEFTFGSGLKSSGRFIPDNEGVSRLQDLVLTATTFEERANALGELANSSSTSQTVALLRAVKDPQIVGDLLVSLAKQHPARAVLVADQLITGSPQEVHIAIKAYGELGAVGGTDKLFALQEMLSTDAYRDAALAALVKLGPNAARISGDVTRSQSLSPQQKLDFLVSVTADPSQFSTSPTEARVIAKALIEKFTSADGSVDRKKLAADATASLLVQRCPGVNEAIKSLTTAPSGFKDIFGVLARRLGSWLSSA